ncbi:MAG: DUF5721 family protein [Lachnospiraceae bacterium]|nr:DUF5721 family protein [Lachnospiraceae bacterium]
MQSLKLPDVKDFMNKLLTTDAFDAFLLSEASVTTFTTFRIDGTYHKDYYGTDAELLEQDPHSAAGPAWKLIRPLFFQIVKGKYTPLDFKLVLRLADYNVEKLLAQSGISLHSRDVAGLFFNLHYNGKEIVCTTGTSLRIFTLEKTLDLAWDTMVQKFLKQQQIPFLLL